MARRLYQSFDNNALERFTKKETVRRRKAPPEKVRMICDLKRALQNLPPRELQMMYATQVMGVEQEQIRKLHGVRQSNISYRLDRARQRIQLYMEIYSIASETQLRRKLFSFGCNEDTVRAITGVVRTSSQTSTAQALEISQGSIRHLFAQAIETLQEKDPGSDELKLLKLIERNYNQLRNIATQHRWGWKKELGGGDTP